MSEILKHSFFHSKNKYLINIWFKHYLKFHTCLTKHNSSMIQRFIEARINKVDLDRGKIIIALQPYCSNPSSIIITIELFRCIQHMNDNLFKKIIFHNTASVSNKSLYGFLSRFSDYVIIQRALENEKNSNSTNIFMIVDEPPIGLFVINGYTIQSKLA